jgi:hypothetical protein
VIDIFEPEEHFAIDQYDDLASTQKPTLTIRQSEVKYVHAFVSKELEIMVSSSRIHLTGRHHMSRMCYETLSLN